MKTGATTTTIVYSRRKRAQIERAKRRQEKRWKAKCGPVVVKNVADLSPEDQARYGV